MNDFISFNVYILLLLLTVLAILIVLVLSWRHLLPMWDRLYESWVKISQFGKHLVLTVGIIVTVGLIAFGCGLFAKSEASKWLCEYDAETYQRCREMMEGSLTSASPTPTPTPTPEVPTPTPTPLAQQASASPNPSPSVTPVPTATPTPLTPEQKARLAAQEQKVSGLIRHHASVMAFFAQAYYAAICVLLFCGAVLAVAMFFIATKGWEKTNQYIKTIFVVMTVTVAFFALWPPVFQQEKNLSDNKALFLEYQTLRNEMRSYPVTRTNVKNEAKEPNDFITYVDSEFARLGNVAVGFDYTKITYKGAFENNRANAPTPTPSATPKQQGAKGP